MSPRVRPFAYLLFDGTSLSTEHGAEGRRLRLDARCLAGAPVQGAFAHVCALADKGAALPYDEPEVQQACRDALEWWVPLLGDSFLCLSTFALDASRYAGAITVARSPHAFENDPFARLFPGTVVETSLFSEVPLTAGPVIERWHGVPWPGGRFPPAA